MAFNRKKTYYVQRDWKGFFPGMELDIAGYSDHKLELFLEEGIIGTKAPDTEENEEKADALVPPVNEADASLPPERRSAEATGQPDPAEEAAEIREATGTQNEEDAAPRRGRPPKTE